LPSTSPTNPVTTTEDNSIQSIPNFFTPSHIPEQIQQEKFFHDLLTQESTAAPTPTLLQKTEITETFSEDQFSLHNQPNDPLFNTQWGLNNSNSWGTPGADIHAPQAWILSKGSRNIKIAIIDSGVNYRLSEISPLYDRRFSYNYINQNQDPMDLLLLIPGGMGHQLPVSHHVFYMKILV